MCIRDRVKATPETLVDELFVDISSLELSEAVRVKDLEVPEGLSVEVPLFRSPLLRCQERLKEMMEQMKKVVLMKLLLKAVTKLKLLQKDNQAYLLFTVVILDDYYNRCVYGLLLEQQRVSL